MDDDKLRQEVRDNPLLAAAKYLCRLEEALLLDDLDMKLQFDGMGPSAFAQLLVPSFDPVEYIMLLQKDK